MTDKVKENGLATVQNNAELAKMYQDAAQVGSSNLQGSIPMLKIHTTNKSQGNELVDGTEPNDGWFFLTGMQEQFQNPVCHIMTVSKGFKAKGMTDSKTNEVGEDKFNQIVGGVIVDGSEYKPFIMYFTGMRLSRLWDFGKEIQKYTHAKPVSIPMFAMRVTLSTEKVKHNFGTSYVVNFQIVKNEDNTPKVVMDAGEFVFLRDSVQSMEQTIESLIDVKSTEPKSMPSANVVKDIIQDEALPWEK